MNMPTKTDVEAQVLGSGSPETQEATRDALIEEIGEEAYYGNPERFWTAQHGGLPDMGLVAARGPQQYLPQQLPDPDIAKAAGLPPVPIPESLVLDPDEAWNHPKGPEPGEQVRLLKNEAVNERVIEEAKDTPSGREFLTLTGDGMAAIRRAQEGEDTPRKRKVRHAKSEDEGEGGDAGGDGGEAPSA